MLFGFVGDAGIGAGLLRGSRAPDRSDLEAFLALQLLVTIVLTVATAAIALRFGLVGQVTTLMVASLPINAFRTPGAILFERELHYQPLVVIELLETLVFYAWAIATVALGSGVWGLASAAPVRALVGALIMGFASPAGYLVPRFSWHRVRSLIAFGVQYQAINGVALLRDQGLNIGTAAIAGITGLGYWNLANRIMQAPFMLFESIWRVSFPAMARLIAAGDEPRPIMEHGLALAALVTGCIVGALVGSSYALVPSVFGPQWAPATSVIPWAAFGLMFGGPVSVATAGYLYAIGDSASVLLSIVLHTLAWLFVAFSLLPWVGIQAIGIGWLAASVVEAFTLVVRTRRHTPILVVRHLAFPIAVGSIAASIGWLAAYKVGPSLISVVVGGGLATAAYAATMLLFRRQLVTDIFVLMRRSVGALGS